MGAEKTNRDPPDPASGEAMSSGAFLRALAEAPPVGMVDRVGQRVAHFEIEGRLGRGGMGEVYLARDTKLERRVALKMLRADAVVDEEGRKRLLREARAAAAVTHRHIVTVYEVGVWEDDLFIAMERVEGESLRDRLRREETLSVERAEELIRMVAAALRVAHRAGIVHRDLKPDNVMLTADGDVKLLDFGLAKLRARQPSAMAEEGTATVTTEDGRVMGTPGYMSPEQATGKAVDHRTDIFALGVMVFEMVTGQRPFVGDSSMDVIIATTRDEPPKPSSVRADARPLEPFILRCLEKEPDARFPDVDALLAGLDQLASPIPPSPRRRRGAAGAVVALVAAAALAGWWSSSSSRQPSAAPVPTAAEVVPLDTAPAPSRSVTPPAVASTVPPPAPPHSASATKLPPQRPPSLAPHPKPPPPAPPEVNLGI